MRSFQKMFILRCVSILFSYSNPLPAPPCVQVTLAMDDIAIYSSSSSEEDEASSDAHCKPPSVVTISDSSTSSGSSPIVINKKNPQRKYIDDSADERNSDGDSSEIVEVSDEDCMEMSEAERERILNPQKKICEVIDTPVGPTKTLFATKKLAKAFVRELCTKVGDGKFAFRQGGSGGRWVDYICRSADCKKYKEWKEAGKKESAWPNVQINVKDREPLSIPMCGFRVCFRQHKSEKAEFWSLVTPLQDESLAVWKHHEKCTGQFTLTKSELQIRFPELLLAAPRAVQAKENLVQK